MYLILYVLYTLLVFISLIILTIAIYYYYKFFTAKFYLYKLHMIPQVPIFGSVLHYSNTCGLYDNLMNYPKKYTKTYWGMAGYQPILFTSDANLLEIILSSSKHIDKPSVYRKIFHSSIGLGLIVANGDAWRIQRKLLTPTFHFKILEQFMTIFNKHSQEYVKMLAGETKSAWTDIHPLTKNWSIAQTTETVMGLKPDGASDDSALYAKAGGDLFQIIMERVIRPFEYIDYTYYFSRNYWKQLRVVKTLDNHIRSVIRRKDKEYDEGLLEASTRVNEDGVKQKIVSLDLLIEYQRRGAALTESDLKEQVQTILFAGYDTTAATVSLAIYNFAKYPEVQEKVFDEVYHVLDGDLDQEITTGHIQEMKYLDLALKESMRVTTSVPLIARELHEDIQWQDTTLPKGLTVVASLCGIHTDPEYYPEPEKFIPERFTAEACKERPPYAYVPFSAGPRNCIGKRVIGVPQASDLGRLFYSSEIWNASRESLLSEIVVELQISECGP